MTSRISWLGVSLALLAVAGCGDNKNAEGPDGGGGSAYSVGGTISGLSASGLVLDNNHGDSLTVSSGATSFVFTTKLNAGEVYDVTVVTQPTGETCTVAQGTGTVNADVRSVNVTCVATQAVVNEWTWESGSDVFTDYGVNGVYGTKGTAAATNVPGGRFHSASWRDSSGNLWLFGGYGKASPGSDGGQLNDLWKYDVTTKQWTWVTGTDVTPASTAGGAAGSAGVYGTKGTAAAANTPGGREQLMTWVDASGTVWLFGGEGIDGFGVTGELNDLWKFKDGQWTWVNGADAVGPALVFPGPTGIYGTKGVAAATNVPGGRYGSYNWIDAQGNLWLFGGSGVDAAGFQGQNSLKYLNDLWKFSPTTGQWTWIAGIDTVTGQGAAGVYGTRGTADAANYPGGRNAGATWMDASGHVWLFGGLGIDSTGTFGFLNDLWMYTTTTNQWTWVSGDKTIVNQPGPGGTFGTKGTAAADNTPGGRYAMATWIDSNGNLWLLGGQGPDSEGGFGKLDDLWKFDPVTKQWTWMNGHNTVGQTGTQSGVYGTLGTMGPNNQPGGRYGLATWTDGSNGLWLFGGLANDSTGNEGYANDLWKYTP